MSTRRIIFLEDDTILAGFYTKKLVSAGYEVKLCENTEDFLKAITTFKPDLAFLDHALRGENQSGFEMIPPLKAANPDVKVVMLSNYSKFQMEETTKDSGAMDYLVKLETSPSDLVQHAKKYLK